MKHTDTIQARLRNAVETDDPALAEYALEAAQKIDDLLQQVRIYQGCARSGWNMVEKVAMAIKGWDDIPT